MELKELEEPGKLEVEIKEIELDDIPEAMINAFFRESDGIMGDLVQATKRIGAFQDDHLVGFATAGPWTGSEGAQALVVRSYYVVPEERGEGVATALMEWMVNVAEKEGYDLLHMETSLAGDFLMGALRKKWEKEGRGYKIETYFEEGDTGTLWYIYFDREEK